MLPTLRFCEIDNLERRPGVYEIYTNTGVALKVGIGRNLRKRLSQHRDSLQRRLKLKPGGNWSNPSDVMSKASILAKHLYYDQQITDQYDLREEADRQKFLAERCYIVVVKMTETIEEARCMEKQAEQTGKFRYIGKVKRFDKRN